MSPYGLPYLEIPYDDKLTLRKMIKENDAQAVCILEEAKKAAREVRAAVREGNDDG